MNRENLIVVEAVSKDDSRNALTGVHLDRDQTVGTDGRMLMAVTYPEGVIPAVRNITIGQEHIKEIQGAYHKDSELKIIKLSEGNLFATIKRQKDHVAFTFEPITSEFPSSWREVIPSTESKRLIAINLRLLGKMCNALMEFHKGKNDSDASIIIEIRESHQPLVIRSKSRSTGQDFVGVIMPMRDDNVDGWQKEQDDKEKNTDKLLKKN